MLIKKHIKEIKKTGHRLKTAVSVNEPAARWSHGADHLEAAVERSPVQLAEVKGFVRLTGGLVFLQLHSPPLICHQ